VHARWNTKIIDALLDGTKKALKDAGVKDENIVIQSVPGSYELPYAVKQYVSHVAPPCTVRAGTDPTLR
jgi:6,7-dimethyl-8-ribityllumazine synthase